MLLKKLREDFAICKTKDRDGVSLYGDFIFTFRTDEEVSFVCETRCIPENADAVEPGWKAFRAEGVLDFGMVGVIAKITGILAEAGISVFVVSTYNTDYVFVKSENFKKSLALLERCGYNIKGSQYTANRRGFSRRDGRKLHGLADAHGEIG